MQRRKRDEETGEQRAKRYGEEQGGEGVGEGPRRSLSRDGKGAW